MKANAWQMLVTLFNALLKEMRYYRTEGPARTEQRQSIDAGKVGAK